MTQIAVDIAIKGGEGSGNFGHRGRPGERGGSAPDGGSSAGSSSSSDARSVFKTRSPKSLTRKEWKGIFSHADQMVEQGKAKDAMSYVAMAISSSKFAKKPKVGGAGLGKIGSGAGGKQSKKKPAAEEPKKEPPGKPEKKEIERWKVIGKTESYSDDPDLALFDLDLTNDEIDTVLDRIPNAKPLPLDIPADKMEAYRRQYDFWREQGSSDWDRVLKIEDGDKFAPLVVGGTPDRWWLLDGSHRMAILAKQKRTKVLAYFDNLKVYKTEKALIVIDIAIKGGEGSGNFGHAGRPGEIGGSAPSSSPAADRIWRGKQHESTGALSKLDTGAIGEKIALRTLAKIMGVPYSTVNVKVNNAPFDVAGDSTAVEVKTGLATNSSSAQQWRATIGQPGKEESAALKQMTPDQKKEHNAWKYQEILRRKHDLLKKMEKEAGREIKPLTIGVILSGDGKAGDVFMVEGFHLRLGWSKYATDQYYVGTYDLETDEIRLKNDC